MISWQPSASLEMLKARAQLLSQLRDFFAARGVLEVETPLLAQTTASDIHIQSWRAMSDSAGNGPAMFLQTSPEFAMKRLLCAGCGSIYQIGKAFRVEEHSKCHNPEFTMLEWYRLNFSLADLMQEVEQLVCSVTSQSTIPRYTYRDVFQKHLGIDPHAAKLGDLETITQQHIHLVAGELQRNDYLQLLLSQVIEPKMSGSWFIYDYPQQQAALAQVKPDDHGTPVAQRFELFCDGMEIANGYQELTDPIEQRRRFESDLDYRKRHQLEVYPLDERLLEALNTGLPNCAGVALGIDRLLMLVTGASGIDQVLTFPTNQA